MVRTPMVGYSGGYASSGYRDMGYSGYSSPPRRGLERTTSYYQKADFIEDVKEIESKRNVDFIPCYEAELATQTIIDNDVAHINDEGGWNRHLIYTSQDIEVYGEDQIASHDMKPVGYTDDESKRIYVQVCHWMGKEPKWARPEDAPGHPDSPFIEHKDASELPGVSRKRVVFDRLQEMDGAIADWNRKNGERLPGYIVAEKLGIYEERERLLREKDDLMDEAEAADPFKEARARPFHQIHIEEQQQVFDALKGRWEAAGPVEDRYYNFDTGEQACEWIIEHVIENPDVEVWYYDPYKPFIYILYSQQDSDKTKRLSCRLETIQGWEDFELRAAARIVLQAHRDEMERREDAKGRLAAMKKAGVMTALPKRSATVLDRTLERFDGAVVKSDLSVVEFPIWAECAEWISKFNIYKAERIGSRLQVTTQAESGPGPEHVHDKVITVTEEEWSSTEISAMVVYLRDAEGKKIVKASGIEKKKKRKK